MYYDTPMSWKRPTTKPYLPKAWSNPPSIKRTILSDHKNPPHILHEYHNDKQKYHQLPYYREHKPSSKQDELLLMFPLMPSFEYLYHNAFRTFLSISPHPC